MSLIRQYGVSRANLTSRLDVRWVSAWTMLLALNAALVFLKAPSIFAMPVMAYEDGTEQFMFYWSHRNPSDVFRFYAGYITLLPNIVGFAVSLLPVRWAAHAYAWSSLAITAGTCSIFLAKRYASIVPSDRARFLICIFLAAAPYGNWTLISNSMFQLWNILLFLFIFFAGDEPFGCRGWKQAALLFLSTLCLWSTPASIILLPIFIWRAIRGGGPLRFNYLLLITATIAYQMFGIQHSTSSVGVGNLIASSEATLFYIADRVIFEAVFGTAIRVALLVTGHRVISLLLGAAALSLLCAFVFRYRRNRTLIRFSAYVAYAVVAVSFVCVAGRSIPRDATDEMRQVSANNLLGADLSASPLGPLAQRYIYVQQLLLLLVVGTVVAEAVGESVASSFPSRWRRVAVAVAFVLVFAFIRSQNGYLWRLDPREGRVVQAFLQDVDWQMRNPTIGEQPRKVIMAGRTEELWLVAVELPRPPLLTSP